MLHSARTADQVWNRPLNLMVTIDYWELEIDHHSVAQEFQRLREEWFAQWSRYKEGTGKPRNGVPTYVYAHEDREGLTHTHWLVHIQPDRIEEFERKLRRKLAKWYGSIDAGTVHIQPVDNAEGAKLYLLKGMDEHYARMCDIDAIYSGEIDGRRAGVSANLGPKFWKPNRDEYRRSGRRGRRATRTVGNFPVSGSAPGNRPQQSA